jgi:hypothetical protein
MALRRNDPGVVATDHLHKLGDTGAALACEPDVRDLFQHRYSVGNHGRTHERRKA